ncbi:MAG: class IV adenylate cyclase [Candidatus Methanomethyliaceae archaeon]|nr:class IV adenylate cyclase [Candidatus Methanomethyliaceae archaeon]MCX8170341.1 class IV adenylate cyclase [Candidatus Methanomethyliaceae archaeon]MDW7971015.1 class IV adenylate cyclase [Nitrososphaerota archaeon]
MGREIEAKARVEEDLTEKILKMGGRFLGEKIQEDIYFEHPCRDFVKSDEAFRLRIEGNKSIITYKGKRESENLKIREEIEVEIKDSKAFINILERLGFKKAYTIRKRRREFLLNEIIICLDDVNGLGSFIELEGGEKLLEIAEKLGIRNLTTESYLEMIIKSKT